MENIENEIRSYFSHFSGAVELFDTIVEVGNVYCLGGMLREYRDNKSIKNLRDADFSVSIEDRKKWDIFLSTHDHKRNRFGGWKFNYNGFFIDVWDINETWGIKKGYVKVDKKEYSSALARSVYLNMDALVYDINRKKWSDKRYNEAMKKKELDIVLENNPFIDLNILRSMILKKRYKMRYSKRLKRVIKERLNVSPDYLDILYKIQINRYSQKILSRGEIKLELEDMAKI